MGEVGHVAEEHAVHVDRRDQADVVQVDADRQLALVTFDELLKTLEPAGRVGIGRLVVAQVVARKGAPAPGGKQ